VLTGGDPLKRKDLESLVAFGTSLGLEMALTPSATPLLTRDALVSLAGAGLKRIALSLDGAEARTHDAVRGFEGSFATTLRAMADARDLGIPVQINTTLTKDNLHELEPLANLLGQQGIVLWSVFFLVPTGRAQADRRLAPDQYEEAFAVLWKESLRQPYAIKTTEAPHYRRYVMETSGAGAARSRVGLLTSPEVPHPRRAPLGANDGKGVLFIGHTGQIYPSGFLPALAGTFPVQSPVDIYRNSAVFRALRDPDQLGGKCGRCEYRQICGGSRARAFALTGSAFAEEPDCVYEPVSDAPRARSTPPRSVPGLELRLPIH
jgi:radical SAM protein with 4Fe4S-binding SPASM domain